MFFPLVKPILRTALLILSLLLYALTILAAYGGRFNTEFFTFPAVMTLALPYLSMATLLVSVLWFIFGKIFAGGFGVLALICSWGPITSVLPFGSSKEPTPGAQTFTLMTYNICHGRPLDGKDSTANRTIDYLINSGVDIICLQELEKFNAGEVPGLTESQEKELRKVYPYFVGDPSNDMKVLSKYPVVFENGYNYVEGTFDQKRFSFFKVNVNGRKLTIINVHLQSFMLTKDDLAVVDGLRKAEPVDSGLKSFNKSIYKKLHKGFKQRQYDIKILRRTINRMKGPMIICGDFNDVPESYAYRLLKGEDLHDAYVETGFGPMVTFNAHWFWFHLDQIFYRGDLKALDVRRGNLKASDHYPVIATFEFK